ncbi:hypothetical protein ACHAXT_003999 [Thalassiosira profunda]
MNIAHAHTFDMMDVCEPSHAYEDFLKCALNEEPAPTAERCISLESDSTPLSIDTTLGSVTGECGDIFEDYDVLPTILGTGHYGCVRECVHRATGAKYAVKSLDKRKASRLDHVQREIELLESIDHPGIMKMVDCYEDADYVHIVSERYTGGELFDMIVDNTTDYGCLPEDHAARIIKQLLEAVRYLSDNDLVHRDIKPENILLESNDEGASIKLIDFGLSRRHGANDAPITNPVGTPYYMSPSVLNCSYDRSCDLWAVGIVAYILLAGYPPFNGNDDYEIQASTLKGNLQFDANVWARLSKSSRHFVSTLLCPTSPCTAEEALRHPWVANA